MPQPEPNEIIDGLIAQVDALKVSLATAEEERNKLNTRCYELEATKDQFQQRRDQAIAEQRAAEDALGKVLNQTPFVESVLASRPQPGSIVIIRAPEFADDAEKQAFQECMAFIARRHPEWTLLLTHHGKDINVEALGETAMRAKGWIRAERVDPGPQILEAACGAYRSALERAAALLASDSAPAARQDLGFKIGTLLKQPLPAVPAEVEATRPPVDIEKDVVKASDGELAADGGR